MSLSLQLQPQTVTAKNMTCPEKTGEKHKINSIVFIARDDFFQDVHKHKRGGDGSKFVTY